MTHAYVASFVRRRIKIVPQPPIKFLKYATPIYIDKCVLRSKKLKKISNKIIVAFNYCFCFISYVHHKTKVAIASE